jgi:hypothetical protein
MIKWLKFTKRSHEATLWYQPELLADCLLDWDGTPPEIARITQLLYGLELGVMANVLGTNVVKVQV